MSPFEERLLLIIRDINVRTCAPARTMSIVAHLGCVPPRTVQWWLQRMERSARVARLSPKTGWLLPERLAHLENEKNYA